MRHIRIVLLTALKDEYDQVLRVDANAVSPRWEESPGEDERLIAKRTFRAAGTSILHVVTTWATEMGGVASAALATSLIHQYRPDVLCMSGICAGREGKVNLGDVIIGDRLWSYDVGKTVVEEDEDGTRHERFEGDAYQYRLPETWLQRAQAFRVTGETWLADRPPTKDVQRRWLLFSLRSGDDPLRREDRVQKCPSWPLIVDSLRRDGYLAPTGLSLTPSGVAYCNDFAIRFPGGLEDATFAVHVAPIASGSKVVEDPEIFQHLSISMRKVLGVEMEASALGAVGHLKAIPVLVAKGVADYARDKDDLFRQFAARASAECVLAFLRTSLPSLLSSGRDGNSLSVPGSQSPNTLPRDNATFTGRSAEIKRLVGELISGPEQQGTALAIDAIDGMPGIGKTALAVHLAHNIAKHFQDGQLFIDLHGYTPGREPLSANEALGALLRDIGIPPGRIGEDLDARASLWRASVADRRVLIVLDNARSHEQLAPLLPGTPGSCVLITSRRRLVGLDGVRSLSLDVLTPDEAVLLLNRVAHRPEPYVGAEALREVARLCGYLPLALRLQAGRWRHRPAWTPEELANHIRDARNRLGPFTSDSSDVEVSFELSYQDLTDRQRLLFRRMGMHPGVHIIAGAAAALCGWSSLDAADVLQELVDHSLVIEPARGRYTFHDLMREFARRRCETEEEATVTRERQRALIQFYLEQASSADGLIRVRRGESSSPKALTHCADRRQAAAWLEQERRNIVACVELAAAVEAHTFVWALAATAAQFFHTAGYNSEAIAMHRRAAESARTLHVTHAEAVALTDLAQSTQAMGQFASAIDCYKSALRLWGEVRDSDGEARALAGLGFTYERTGDYPRALEQLEQALKVREGHPDAFNEANALNAIGAVRWRMRQYDEALTTFDRALALRRSIGDRHGEARTVNNIGFTYTRLAQYTEAESHLLMALEIARDLSDRNSECVTLNNLGYTLELSGQLSRAFEYASRGLELAQHTGSLYEQGRALDALAKCFLHVKSVDLATKHWQLSLAFFEQAGVPEAQEVRTQMERLARE